MLLGSTFWGIFSVVGISVAAKECDFLLVRGVTEPPILNGYYSLLPSDLCSSQLVWRKEYEGAYQFIYYVPQHPAWNSSRGWVIGDKMCSYEGYGIRGAAAGNASPLDVGKWEEKNDENWIPNYHILLECFDATTTTEPPSDDSLLYGEIMLYTVSVITAVMILCCIATIICRGEPSAAQNRSSDDQMSIEPPPSYEASVHMPRSRSSTQQSAHSNVILENETEEADATEDPPPLYQEALHMPVLAESPPIPRRVVPSASPRDNTSANQIHAAEGDEDPDADTTVSTDNSSPAHSEQRLEGADHGNDENSTRRDRDQDAPVDMASQGNGMANPAFVLL